MSPKDSLGQPNILQLVNSRVMIQRQNSFTSNLNIRKREVGGAAQHFRWCHVDTDNCLYISQTPRRCKVTMREASPRSQITQISRDINSWFFITLKVYFCLKEKYKFDLSLLPHRNSFLGPLLSSQISSLSYPNNATQLVLEDKLWVFFSFIKLTARSFHSPFRFYRKKIEGTLFWEFPLLLSFEFLGEICAPTPREPWLYHAASKSILPCQRLWPPGLCVPFSPWSLPFPAQRNLGPIIS